MVAHILIVKVKCKSVNVNINITYPQSHIKKLKLSLISQTTGTFEQSALSRSIRKDEFNESNETKELSFASY